MSDTEPDVPLTEPDWPGVKKRQAHKADQVAAIAAGIGEYEIANACYRLAAVLTARTECAALQRGIVPPGTYAGGGRSPIVYALLCPPCAGYAPITGEDYSGFLSGRCQGCGADSRELHRFQALILSAANGGCMCTTEHRQVAGDLPTEETAMGVLIEVRTRPGG